MNTRPQIQLRFVSDDTFIDDLALDLTSTDEAIISTRRPVTDPSNLGFDLKMVTELIALVNSVASLAPILIGLFHRRTPPRILIESAFGRVVFEPSNVMTEEQVRQKLRTLAEL
jgi:hypothetical protein